jgi:glycine cleavage system H protein
VANYPSDLKYDKEHEWVRVDGDSVVLGISDFAQDQLGEVVFVDLPEVGSEVVGGETFGEVESVKSVSDLFSPVTGSVVERNDNLSDAPETVNEDPYGDGWLIKVKMNDASELDALMDAAEYEDFVAGDA